MHDQTQFPRIEALLFEKTWCSPRVGTFIPAFRADDQVFLGRLVQNGRTFDVVLPTGSTTASLLVQAPSPVEYGTPLADALDDMHKPKHVNATNQVIAPCDGFLKTAPDGQPLFVHGDLVRPGDVVAVIELMKLGVDVVYQGNDVVTFNRYTEKNTVKRGDWICEFMP